MPANRQDQCRRACDVLDDRQSCARCCRAEDGVGRVGRRAQGERDFGDDDLGVGARRDIVGNISASVVHMVGDQYLITLGEVVRAEHGVDAGRSVRHEGEVVMAHSEKVGQHGAGLVELPFHLALEEPHRLRFEAAAPFGLRILDGARSRPEGAVVEEVDGAVEGPEAVTVAPHRRILPAVPDRHC